MAEPSTEANYKPWNDPAATPFVQIKGITKQFDGITAVDDVSLDIYKGELFCLLGGSGCGKSTLLRMLAGFEEPTAGEITIDGQAMAGVAPYDRPTNMMFQSYALFPHMTVEKNVAYGLLRQGMAKAEAMEKTAAMLKLVQLEKFAGRKPSQLSGGQQQRVALARSLIKQPKLLLLDEPLGALDKKLREETQFELIRIQETLGVTFIVVTHDQEEAMTLSTRIGVMDEGKIVQVGEPRQIYEHPETTFVADFIGSVNLLKGKVEIAVAKEMRVQTSEGPVICQPVHGLTAGQTISIALRPERIILSREKPQAANVRRGVVTDVAYRGSLSIFHVRLENGQMLNVTGANHPGDDNPITWDEQVYVGWSSAAGRVLLS